LSPQKITTAKKGKQQIPKQDQIHHLENHQHPKPNQNKQHPTFYTLFEFFSPFDKKFQEKKTRILLFPYSYLFYEQVRLVS
jgi:hypothetical protein